MDMEYQTLSINFLFQVTQNASIQQKPSHGFASKVAPTEVGGYSQVPPTKGSRFESTVIPLTEVKWIVRSSRN